MLVHLEAGISLILPYFGDLVIRSSVILRQTGIVFYLHYLDGQDSQIIAKRKLLFLAEIN